jgi:hypothetical protein
MFIFTALGKLKTMNFSYITACVCVCAAACASRFGPPPGFIERTYGDDPSPDWQARNFVCLADPCLADLIKIQGPVTRTSYSYYIENSLFPHLRLPVILQPNLSEI